ncbi:MAG: hypothetical protein Q8R70_05820 [Methanoregula sp.]|nr:hypothetical protein [Methanoregula sp.]
MTTRKSGQELDADEEFFCNHLRCRGRDPSLFSLWQLLNTEPLPSPAAVAENL